MTAPLEHLIRNSLAHGIETPEQRTQQGKSRAGRIILSVSRDESEIVFRFRDDGRGLDRQRLHERAVAMGLISSDQTLPEAELDRLILRPGFSTAPTVDQIAGRGIGMDVVHSELKALGGSLQIESRPNEGVEFIMRLPFTLVVNPVLLAELQGQVYALPIAGVQGLARLTGQQIQEALQAEGRAWSLRQHYLLRQLADWLGASRGEQLFQAEERFPVVFVLTQGQAVAWVIDRIRGRREVVLQPLGSLFKNCRLYSAATVAPDGSVFWCRIWPSWRSWPLPDGERRKMRWRRRQGQRRPPRRACWWWMIRSRCGG
ncbi:MAG: chemotaxis protein CheW [Candidatus Thiothrix singaporensis]|uniref:Chemotaxis protein CheA n=1 Tax=Candidatus Thiothrix singaporensis TaxID=2799669 RepID=A0A7L6AX83_9GAMM|nr:MAG: chemotaxis protein CheW [Candidatus Thiothrix singaporensis]